MDNSLLIKLGASIDELSSGLHKSKGLLHEFGEEVAEIGKSLAGAFALEKILEFGKEVSELAAKAAGVKNAFAEIPHSTALLAGMRTTVHSTVDELTLMKDAVRAEHLGIPLQNLGTILEFVHQRALATGGDFQEMAEKLIRGVGKGGRGMIGAMSELQISTVRYKEAVKETGSVMEAVMKLAEEEISKTNATMDHTYESIERASAAWKNFKIGIGETENKSGVGASFLNQWTHFLNLWTEAFSGKSLNPLRDLKYEVETLNKLVGKGDFNRFNETLDKTAKDAETLGYRLQEITDGTNTVYALWKNPVTTVIGGDVVKEIETIESLSEKVRDLTEQQATASGVELSNINLHIKALQEKIRLLKEQGIPGKPVQDSRDVTAAKLGTLGAPDQHMQDLAAANKKLLDGFKLLTEETDGWANDSSDSFDRVKNHGKEFSKILDQINTKQKMMHELGNAAAQDLVGGFRSIIEGSASVSEAVGQMVEQFGLQMLTMALSGIIADAMNPESNGGNYYYALALAGAGIAAVGAMFASIGVSGGGSSGAAGGNSGGGTNSSSSTYRAISGEFSGNSQNVHVTVDGRISGRDIQLSLAKQEYYDGRTIRTGP